MTTAFEQAAKWASKKMQIAERRVYGMTTTKERLEAAKAAMEAAVYGKQYFPAPVYAQAQLVAALEDLQRAEEKLENDKCAICGNEKSLARIGEALGFRPDIMAAEIRKLREELAKYESGAHVLVPRGPVAEVIYSNWNGVNVGWIAPGVRLPVGTKLYAAQQQEKE